MTAKRVGQFSLAAFFGILLVALTLDALLGKSGAGHNHNNMPEKALFAPDFSYMVSWPILMPLAFSRVKVVRNIVKYCVLSQCLLTLYVLFAEDGIDKTMDAIGARIYLGHPVIMSILAYVLAVGTMLYGTLRPIRPTVKAEEQNSPQNSP